LPQNKAQTEKETQKQREKWQRTKREQEYIKSATSAVAKRLKHFIYIFNKEIMKIKTGNV